MSRKDNALKFLLGLFLDKNGKQKDDTCDLAPDCSTCPYWIEEKDEKYANECCENARKDAVAYLKGELE